MDKGFQKSKLLVESRKLKMKSVEPNKYISYGNGLHGVLMCRNYQQSDPENSGTLAEFSEWSFRSAAHHILDGTKYAEYCSQFYIILLNEKKRVSWKYNMIGNQLTEFYLCKLS